MKKIILISLFSFAGIILLPAQILVLHHANGKTTDVELSVLPKVLFENNKIYITSTLLDMEYPQEDVLRFTYKRKSTGFSVPSLNAKITQENDKWVFHGLKTTDKIAVFKTNGIRVPVSITRQGNSAFLSLNSLPQGVYLLKVNGKTSKFTRK